jgi:hypothetical protein
VVQNIRYGTRSARISLSRLSFALGRTPLPRRLLKLGRAFRRERDLRCAVIFKTVRVQAARLLALEVSSAISDKTLIAYAASSIRTIRRPLGCRPSG